MQDLGTLTPGAQSWANAINASGMVAGAASGHAVRWSASGSITDLGIPAGWSSSWATDINAQGDAVGYAVTGPPPGYRAPYEWTVDGQTRNLGLLAGYESAVAMGINDVGQIVGYAENSCTFCAGTAWVMDSGVMYDLEAISSMPPGWTLEGAWRINNLGQIIGTAHSPTGLEHAILLTPGYVQMYRPQLRLDTADPYWPISAGSMTDNCQGAPVANGLLDALETRFADACASGGLPQLSLGYLGGTYPGGRLATTSDHIDAVDNYTSDSKNLFETGYGNVIYGRMTTDPGAPGDIFVQYWLFYYYNQKIGDDHEGDWEMIQIHLDRFGKQLAATYAQHTGGEKCTWSKVQTTTAGGRPIVFVGLGSHASFFSAGEHDLPPAAFDITDGQAIFDSLAVVDITSPPGWVNWPGLWGGSGHSPTGPGIKSQWNAPLAWENAASGCTR